jgi:exodeoxyribonuclease VII large subunit
MDEPSFSVSEFVDVFNQTLDFAYPSVSIVGELANFRISKNRWVYFDLKDETSSVKFFGTVYRLPGPLEEGMMLKVTGQPHLHNLYGFNVNVLNIVPSGEGSLLKAANLLQAKLTKEGLFDESRKRPMPYPPERLALVTSEQSAAYADFTKIINARWGGVRVDLIDVQVQGQSAVGQIIKAIDYFNSSAEKYDALVLIRGGGSADDLAVFSTEQVTRAVAGSRIPTIVAIGHEIDISLAELAADRRASTPSNAAELLVPDKVSVIRENYAKQDELAKAYKYLIDSYRNFLAVTSKQLTLEVKRVINDLKKDLILSQNLLNAYNPEGVLKRGYAIVKKGSDIIKLKDQVKKSDLIEIQLYSGKFEAEVK